MAMTLHRDLFVGTVAEELNKNGYFGKEVEWYCFLYWDGQNRFSEIFEDERECVKAQIALTEKGYLVSEYILFKGRVYKENKKTMDILKQNAQNRLETLHGEALQVLIERTSAETISGSIEIKKHFHSSGQAEIAGFAWIEESGIKYFVNAYLPNVWKKWRKYKDAGMEISYLYIEAYDPNTGRSVCQIKEAFYLALEKRVQKDGFFIFGSC